MDEDEKPSRKSRRRGNKFQLPDDVRRVAMNADKDIFDFQGFETPEDLEPDTAQKPDDMSDAEWSAAVTKSRLEYLRGLLSRALYEQDVHPEILATKWNTTAGRVRRLVTEAMRQLEVLHGQNSKVAGETIVARLLAISEEARAVGSFMAAVSALKSAGEFIIDPKTQKVDISHELRGMSDEDLRQLYEKELKEAQRVIGALPVKSTDMIPDAEFTPIEDNGDRITPIMPEDPNEDDSKSMN